MSISNYTTCNPLTHSLFYLPNTTMQDQAEKEQQVASAEMASAEAQNPKAKDQAPAEETEAADSEAAANQTVDAPPAGESDEPDIAAAATVDAAEIEAPADANQPDGRDVIVDWSVFVKSLDIHSLGRKRSRLRWSKNPKLHKWCALSNSATLQIFKGFDNLPLHDPLAMDKDKQVNSGNQRPVNVATAGTRWDFLVTGAAVTMCTLVGFHLRLRGWFLLCVDEDTVRRMAAQEDVSGTMAAQNFKKMGVQDLFENGMPKRVVDLELVEMCEMLVDTMHTKFAKEISFWEDVPIIRSVQRHNAITKTMKEQKELLKKKQQRQKAQERKRQLALQKKMAIKVKNLRLAREKRAAEQRKNNIQRATKRNARRKRDREIKKKIKAETEASAAKIQRVALDALSKKHRAEIKILSSKHEAVIRDLKSEQQSVLAGLRDELKTLKSQLEETTRIAEQQKLLSTIDSLKNELKILREERKPTDPVGHSLALARALQKVVPKNSVGATAVATNAAVPPAVPANAVTRSMSVDSSSSSGASSGVETPVDPDCRTPYDPLAPICANLPMRRTPVGGYDYFQRQIMTRQSRDRLPTRRSLPFTTPPQYGGYGWF